MNRPFTITKPRKSVVTAARLWSQVIVFVLTLAIGLQFYLYVRQASGSGIVTIPRPAGVEAFLPIGALMAWKQFLLTGVWDATHPAAMVLFGFALGISLLFHKAFCSWFCPIGTLSEWVWKAGRNFFGRNVLLPKWLDFLLRSVKYLLLGFFLWIILTMPVDEIRLFLSSPYYKISDAKMLRFFSHMTLTTAVVLAFLFVGSLLVKNFWCRYFCPYGALTGILGMIGPTRIRRNKERCTGCGKCSETCPHRIDVKNLLTVASPECSGCMDCVVNCPVENTLSFTSGFMPGRHQWSGKALGLTIMGCFLLFVYLATITGQWKSRLPESEFRHHLKNIDSPQLTHPGI